MGVSSNEERVENIVEETHSEDFRGTAPVQKWGKKGLSNASQLQFHFSLRGNLRFSSSSLSMVIRIPCAFHILSDYNLRLFFSFHLFPGFCVFALSNFLSSARTQFMRARSLRGLCGCPFPLGCSNHIRYILVLWRSTRVFLMVKNTRVRPSPPWPIC